MQVKKAEVHDAIVDSATKLFSRNGYAKTTIGEIAKEAGLPTSNIYVYFSSKLEILWAVMTPWLHEQFDALELELASISSSEARIKRLLLALWRDIPMAQNNLASNLLQGIALSEPDEKYSRKLLFELEKRVSEMLAAHLPAHRRDILTRDDAFSHLLFMAFDGFVLATRLQGKSRRVDQVVAIMLDFLFGDRR
ncbi:TetR/AcrR family transcriptional regulator [Aquibium sp. A9E412]|uniref:TetR/AcrR family transcriptional regulator n=1 Tax=Aquibium sp. A9E412 TaxID=2976767 RepID=UPI0025B254F4|nr:TetR/AcrR family transcriptional regulator [Aquibium sp. A9E412]MDN2564629.1 TetR/AcrR family transcriptional regulator [Aquibium sp. A9E412]